VKCGQLRDREITPPADVVVIVFFVGSELVVSVFVVTISTHFNTDIF